MKRAGFVAVIGAPNVGKSTLVNRLVGRKVSIATRKAQTTRFPVRGIAIRGAAQLVLVDTPGIFEPRRSLDRAMVRAAWSGAQDADAVVHLIDAKAHARVAAGGTGPGDHRAVAEDEAVGEKLAAAGRSAILALNKCDLVRPSSLLPIIARLGERAGADAVFMISAETGDGVEDLAARLANHMPAGDWLYPPDASGDLPLAHFAAEITREKLYLRVHDELPYVSAVETTALEDREDGSLRIDQTILVERPSQRGILIGRGGETLRAIGQAARLELSAALGRTVHLFLLVKVAPGWLEKGRLYRDLGLEYGG